MEIVLKRVSELKQYKKNAKLHPEWQVKQIADSIEKFGFNDPIAIDEKGVIIEGHGRFLACKLLDMLEVPTICLDHMTDQEKKAYILAHNKINMSTDFDIETLNSELEEISDFDMGDFGFISDFSEEEFDEILKEREEVEIRDNFNIIVECDTEQQQEEFYNKFESEGIKCRISQ